jgi:prepilin-type N-terminal cleavage/methylation domain-containing protein
MMNRAQKGFTLIELLVVIAIIGLLASIVLAAVGTARKKGQDAAIKSQMESARSQMELYASNNNAGYSGGCVASGDANPPGLEGILANANADASKGGSVNTSDTVGGSYQNVTCHDDQSDWAAEAPLSPSASGSPNMWCVDDTGAAKLETVNLGSNVYTCP